MKKNIFLSLTAIIAVFLLYSFIDPDKDFFNNLVNNIEKYQQKYPAEHVYLHTDKTVYRPGDDVWFKAYIDTQPVTSSSRSEKLFVVLMDNKGQEHVKEVFLTGQNAALGDFKIPYSIEDGTYHIIAYTSWMKNQNVESIFDKTITISSSVVPFFNIETVFDKDYYIPGNKATSTFFISDRYNKGLANVKLKYAIQHNGIIIQKDKVKTNNDGKADVEFDIPAEDDFKGNLTLVIESKYARNKEHLKVNIPIVSDIDLQLFPEGGYLIEGKHSEIAFRAVTDFGKPFDFEGILVNSEGNQMQKVKTFYKGMGSFSLKPAENQQYSIEFNIPGSTKKFSFDIPEAEEEGLIMSLNEMQDSAILIDVATSSTNIINKIFIVVQQKGDIVWAAKSALKDKTTVKVPVDDLQPGIIRITVFNSLGIPKTERLVFVNKKQIPNIFIDTDKDVYAPREQVTMNISLRDNKGKPIPGNISLAVSDELFTTENPEQTIQSSFLLDAELKGTVASPAWYFQEKDSADKALDLVMMTHGWRRFQWDSVLQVEKLQESRYTKQDGISGLVVNNRNRAVPKAKIIVTNKVNFDRFSLFADKSGTFYVPFSEYNLASHLLDFSVTSPDGSQKYHVITDHSFADKVASFCMNISPLSEQTFYQEEDARYVNYQQVTPLNPEYYKKEIPDTRAAQKWTNKNTPPQKDYSSRTSVMEIIKEIKNFTMIGDKIVFPGNRNSFYNQQGALIVVDGVMLGDNSDVLQTIAPSDIADINVTNDLTEVHRYSALYSAGLIEITTKRGPGFTPESKNQNAELVNRGFRIPREFYAPRYDDKSKNKNQPDLRTTIYWNPEIIIGNSGDTTITFYNGDIKSRLILTAEGLIGNNMPSIGKGEYGVDQ